MSVPTTKQQLLDQLQQERAIWEALLAEIGPERMEVPGVTGDWTMKDTIAHMTTWWRRDVARLAAVQRDERPPAHPPQSEVSIINQWEHLTNRDRPFADVLHDSQDVWQQFAEKLQEFPEDTLFDRERFAWMDRRALGPGSLEDFIRHFHEQHEPPIRTWLRQQKDH
ncbi:MAG: ClbS/DfsB family four-helix bundle protein [Roseiflexaceae bacterium]